jgi:hypothetical protein
MRMHLSWVYLLKRLNVRLAVSDARSASPVAVSVQLLYGRLKYKVNSHKLGGFHTITVCLVPKPFVICLRNLQVCSSTY